MDGTLRFKVKRTFSLREVYTVLIALLPAISFYNIPFLEVSWATFFLVASLPYPIACFFRRGQFHANLWFCTFIAYLLFRSGGDGSNIFLTLLVLIHVLGAFNDSLDFSLLNRTIQVAITISAVLVLLQSVLYYLFHVRTTLLIPSLLRAEEQVIYFSNNAARASTLFRPSGLLLEPAQFAQYCMPALLYLLFFAQPVPRRQFRLAIFLAVCCLLTTSGIGLLSCAAILLWYAFLTYRSRHPELAQTLLLTLVLAGALALALSLPLIRLSLDRIFFSVDNYNAVSGRLFFWDSTVGTMSTQDLIFGLSATAQPDKYMTGFMQLLYCDGIVGVALFLCTLLSLLWQSKTRYVTGLALGYGLLLFAGNLISFISLSFWFCLLAAASKHRAPKRGRRRDPLAAHYSPSTSQLYQLTKDEI